MLRAGSWQQINHQSNNGHLLRAKDLHQVLRTAMEANGIFWDRGLWPGARGVGAPCAGPSQTKPFQTKEGTPPRTHLQRVAGQELLEKLGHKLRFGKKTRMQLEGRAWRTAPQARTRSAPAAHSTAAHQQRIRRPRCQARRRAQSLAETWGTHASHTHRTMPSAPRAGCSNTQYSSHMVAMVLAKPHLQDGALQDQAVHQHLGQDGLGQDAHLQAEAARQGCRVRGGG